MSNRFKLLFRFEDTRKGVAIALRGDILQELNLQPCGCTCIEVLTKNVPHSVNEIHSPFSVRIMVSETEKVSTIHNDFIEAIKQGEKTLDLTRAYIFNSQGAVIAEIDATMS